MHTKFATSKKELIFYFLQTDGDEVRSAQALADNFDLAMKQGLNSKELALVLYHATLKAKNGIYGEDTKAALREIECRLQTWTDKALTQTRTITPYTLAHMMHGFSLLELRPPQRFIDQSMELANALVPNFNADDASYFLESLARLAIPAPKKTIGLLQKRMPSIINSFASEQAYRVVHSMAILDAVNEHHFGRGKASLSQLYSDTLKDSRFRAKLAEAQHIGQTHMLSDSLLWFKGDTPINRTEQDDTVSLFEGDVKHNLELAGASVSNDTIISKLKHRVDLTAVFNDKAILIECDGPSHSVKSVDDHKMYLNGNTILQTGLIQKAQPNQNIVRIPHDVFYQHMNDQDFWETFLLTIDEAETGAYILDNNGLIELVAGKHSALQNE